jgi:peptidoglycan/LPS O-acetylase OafA/YrhL
MAKRLLYMIGVAVLGVILFHSAGTELTAMFFWGHRFLPASVNLMDQMGSHEYFLLRAIEQIVVAAIPIFLFVSGYFITISTGRSQANLSWRLIANRIKNLMIPYLVWSVVIILLLVLQGQRMNLSDLVLRLLTGGTSSVLYFVPLLIQFYLLAPLLVPLAQKRWRLLLVMTGIMQMLIQLVQYPMLLGLDLSFANSLANMIPKWFFLARLFWFSLGMVVGFHGEEFRKAVTPLRFWLLGLVLLTIPIGMLEWEYYVQHSGLEWLDHRETILDSLYSLGVILTFLAFIKVNLPVEKTIGNLGGRSYGIFLTHALFIEYTAKIFYRFAPDLLGIQWLLLPILIVVGLAGPLIMMAIVAKIPIPKLYGYIFG